MGVAVLLSGFAATGAFAQDDPCADIDGATAVYDKFTGSYAKKLPANPDVAALQGAISDKQGAIESGKQFLEKWGNCEAWKDQVAFVKPWVPKLEKQIDALKLQIQYVNFDTGMQAKNWDAVYSAGKEIDRMAPDKSVDQLIVLGMIGLVESYNKNNKYNDESLNYARKAIDKMNSGTQSVNGKWGVFQFAFGSKENAISELSYATGYILYYGKGDKKGGVAQMYKISQMPGSKKDYAPLFATIGEFYLSEAEPIGKEIAAKIEAIKTATTDGEKLKIDAEVKEKVALFNGYTERAMDAFSRAWNFAKTDTPAGQKYKDGLYKQIQDLYKRRFDKDDGVSSWVSTAVAKPLPDPASAVQPVTDPDIDKATTTTGDANGTGVGAANGTGVGTATKPAAKPAATAVKAKPNK